LRRVLRVSKGWSCRVRPGVEEGVQVKAERWKVQAEQSWYAGAGRMRSKWAISGV
jgi:hypothetical protein